MPFVCCKYFEGNSNTHHYIPIQQHQHQHLDLNVLQGLFSGDVSETPVEFCNVIEQTIGRRKYCGKYI
jgi:hypothetical protein